MSTPPFTKERQSARAGTNAATSASSQQKPAVDDTRPSMADRILTMTDKEIVSFQANATRISQAQAHPKRDAAVDILALIEAEIARRAVAKTEEDATRRATSAAKRAATAQARKKAASKSEAPATTSASQDDAND